MHILRPATEGLHLDPHPVLSSSWLIIMERTRKDTWRLRIAELSRLTIENIKRRRLYFDKATEFLNLAL